MTYADLGHLTPDEIVREVSSKLRRLTPGALQHIVAQIVECHRNAGNHELADGWIQIELAILSERDTTLTLDEKTQAALLHREHAAQHFAQAGARLVGHVMPPARSPRRGVLSFSATICNRKVNSPEFRRHLLS